MSINIDKDNFNEALRAQRLTLYLAVPNQLDENVDKDGRILIHQ
ncbi:MAG: type VI secretion system contractile sheath small subunit [Candidatus Binataceae bacterium]